MGTHLYGHVRPAGSVVEHCGLGQEDQGVAVHGAAAEELLGADDHLVRRRARLKDVAGPPVGGRASQAQALALAHGEAEVAVVGAEHLTSGRDQGEIGRAHV